MSLASRALPLTVALVLSAAGCAAGEDVAAGEPVPTTAVDLPRSYRFAPERIAVDAGDEVTWTNSDQFTHNVVVLEPDRRELGTMRPGESVAHAFDEAGTYRYQCTLHPADMNGEVVVQA